MGSGTASCPSPPLRNMTQGPKGHGDQGLPWPGVSRTFFPNTLRRRNLAGRGCRGCPKSGHAPWVLADFLCKSSFSTDAPAAATTSAVGELLPASRRRNPPRRCSTERTAPRPARPPARPATGPRIPTASASVPMPYTATFSTTATSRASAAACQQLAGPRTGGHGHRQGALHRVARSVQGQLTDGCEIAPGSGSREGAIAVPVQPRRLVCLLIWSQLFARKRSLAGRRGPGRRHHAPAGQSGRPGTFLVHRCGC